MVLIIMEYLTAIAEENETIDELCFRILGETRYVVEQVYKHNPTLSRASIFLPSGFQVLIPLEVSHYQPEYDLWN